ncbi:TetR family transcriptional regulator C-terminal domain-containing protein [Phyllobacterium bourgognense]|uniref:TetR family transcriptional regulator n=1 Tax=Phyllobacterium bourgognense TaxID=314236 RepID=A0A368YI31_9HYPH|nr:TetR family transcriptional regulator C-terminal domain-containing protein [Phyllobacterium bourgognense]RCW77834.1 TetR family transcriptional regulator [Phyllobacterium bourgognense]
MDFGAWSGYFETCIAQAQEDGAIDSRLPAGLLARFVLNSWEGALLRMRANRSDEPLLEFKSIVFNALLT